jgi:T-box protein 21
MKPAFLPSAPGSTMFCYRGQEVLAPGAGLPVTPQYPPKMGPLQTLPMEPGPRASGWGGPEEQGFPSLWIEIIHSGQSPVTQDWEKETVRGSR